MQLEVTANSQPINVDVLKLNPVLYKDFLIHGTQTFEYNLVKTDHILSI